MTSLSTHGPEMPSRPVSHILAEWRDAQRRLEEDPCDSDVASLVQQLRTEYLAAMSERDWEAKRLAAPARLRRDS